MASKTQAKARGKGTGSIIKKKNRFYFRTREDGKEKYTLLRGEDGEPVTRRTDAEIAASNLEPVLTLKSKEDMAHYISKVRGFETPKAIPLEDVWETYLKQPGRPDSGETTLKKYNCVWRMFHKWLKENRKEIRYLSEVNDEAVRDFFNCLETTGVSDQAKKGLFGKKAKHPSKDKNKQRKHQAKQQAKSVSGRTYNGYKQTLQLIFKHLLPLMGMDHNPIEQIANKVKDTVTREEFTEEQVEAIFNGFDTGFFYETTVERNGRNRERERTVKRLQFKPMNQEQLKVLLYLCCYTGCRGQDGCLMEWSNIDLTKGIISYVPHKTARKSGKRATIPLHPSLKQALENALEWRNTNLENEDYILPAIAKRYKYNSGGIQKDVMKIIRCATGCSTKFNVGNGRRVLAANRYSLHSFRHTFVSFCAISASVMRSVYSVFVVTARSAWSRTSKYSTSSSETRTYPSLVGSMIALRSLFKRRSARSSRAEIASYVIGFKR